MRVRIYRAELNALKGEARDKAAKRAADITVRRVRSEIRAAGRVRTGRMISSVSARKKSEGRDRTVYSVGAGVPYDGYQNDGIGPVRAIHGRVLAFVPKGSGTVIFRPRTSGFSGARFYEKALRALGPSDFLGVG